MLVFELKQVLLINMSYNNTQLRYAIAIEISIKFITDYLEQC